MDKTLSSKKSNKHTKRRHPAFERSEEFKRKRKAMVQTAAYLFNRTGFHVTSINDISEALGISPAAVYYYFSDKTALLYHCHLSAIEKSLILAQAADEGGGSGIEKLERYIRSQFQALISKEGTAWVFGDISALKPSQREDIVVRSREVDSFILRFIEQGVADESIAISNPRITEFFMIGALNWVPRWYRPESNLTAEDLTEIFLQFAFDGMRPRCD